MQTKHTCTHTYAHTHKTRMHANKSARAIGMWRRHYAKRARGLAGPPLHLHWWSGRVDEDLVWLKLQSKNHQLATLAINIVISLFISGTNRSVEPPEYQSSSSLQLCILRNRFVKCDVWALLVNCPSGWSLHLSLAVCVDHQSQHHSNREKGPAMSNCLGLS